MSSTAVIVNEFGEVGLDHLLITPGREDTILLDSGCLCCMGNDDLQNTLMMLLARSRRGEIPVFHRVVIETSGLADPAPVLQPLLADAFIARNFVLGEITTVVDAALGAAQLAQHPEARKQVAVADRLVLSKFDIVRATDAAATASQVLQLNPRGTLSKSSLPILDAAALLGIGQKRQAVSTDAGRGDKILDVARESGHVPAHRGNGRQLDGHDHSHGIASFVFRPEEPISWGAYAQWISSLQAIDGTRLLRTKGLLRFDDGTLRVIQGVQHVFSTPTTYDGSDVEPFVIMIVQGLKKETLAPYALALMGQPAISSP